MSRVVGAKDKVPLLEPVDCSGSVKSIFKYTTLSMWIENFMAIDSRPVSVFHEDMVVAPPRLLGDAASIKRGSGGVRLACVFLAVEWTVKLRKGILAIVTFRSFPSYRSLHRWSLRTSFGAT